MWNYRQRPPDCLIGADVSSAGRYSGRGEARITFGLQHGQLGRMAPAFAPIKSDTRGIGGSIGQAGAGFSSVAGSRLSRRGKVPQVIAHASACSLLLSLMASQASAYIGPGAGFAFLSSFFLLFTSLLISIFLLLTWPSRAFLRRFRRKKAYARAMVDRVVVIGLDGLDPELCLRFMAEGQLPHLAKLRAEGSFAKLQTTFPPISPVAWSSFSTGVNPGRHNIYDFLSRDPRTYQPMLSSAEVSRPSRHVSVGTYSIPLGKPRCRLLRKSQTFWKVLGEHGIFSTVLRVPITFPPEKFHGIMRG